MTSLLQHLRAGDILVADGAMGSQLMALGLAPGACPELANLQQPQLPRQIAAAYFEAGARIVQTNTFGASPFKLERYGLAAQTEATNQAAARIVREVVGKQAYVSGSCGPSGRILLPFGDTAPETLEEGFRRQIGALLNAGVDVICVETMIDLQEAAIAVRAAKALAPEIPVMATMTFDLTPGGFFTMMGVSIEAACRGLAEAGADILGSNCGNGIEKMVEIARQMREMTDLPLVIQANAGQPRQQGDRTIYPETPEFFALHVPPLLAAGVSIIGGCCGTTPEHIRAIATAVNQARQPFA